MLRHPRPYVLERRVGAHSPHVAQTLEELSEGGGRVLPVSHPILATDPRPPSLADEEVVTPCSPQSDQQCQCREGAFYCDSVFCRENCYRCTRCWPRGRGRTGRGARVPHLQPVPVGIGAGSVTELPAPPHPYAGARGSTCLLEVTSDRAPGCLCLAAGLESASHCPWMRGHAVDGWEPSVACQCHCRPGPQPCRRQIIETQSSESMRDGEQGGGCFRQVSSRG